MRDTIMPMNLLEIGTVYDCRNLLNFLLRLPETSSLAIDT